MKRREAEGGVGTFTKEQVNQVLADLVGAGWDTTLTTLKWLFLYMSIYPDVQVIELWKKCQLPTN
jgi:ecdysteroid 25-hydroxylase CYP306A1